MDGQIDVKILTAQTQMHETILRQLQYLIIMIYIYTFMLLHLPFLLRILFFSILYLGPSAYSSSFCTFITTMVLVG